MIEGNEDLVKVPIGEVRNLLVIWTTRRDELVKLLTEANAFVQFLETALSKKKD